MTEQFEIKKKTPPQKSNPFANRGLLFLVFILALISIGIALYNFKTMQSLEKNQQLTQTANQEQQNQLQATQTQLQQFINKINPSDQGSWQIAEAIYLIHLANYQIYFQKNPELALQLIQAADKNLKPVLDRPGVSRAKQSIADDMIALKGIPSINTDELLRRLTALENELAKLPLKGPHVLFQTKSKESTEKQLPPLQMTLSHWKENFETTLEKLKGLIIIRHRTEAITPLLAPNQQAYLLQNLHLLLQRTQWALIYKKDKIYHDTFSQIEKIVRQYFNTDDAHVKAALEEINALQQLDLNPPLPNLEKTLQTLQALKNRLNDQPTSTAEET